MDSDTLLETKSDDELKQKQVYVLSQLTEEVVFCYTPSSVSELDAAATKIQKVYKSYLTRKHLAECAVVVEELWWKALEFSALKRSSISLVFDDKKPDTAESDVSRWKRVRELFLHGYMTSKSFPSSF